MLTFCALLFFGLSGLRAQVAYNFQIPDDIPAVAGTGHNVLTMDCLAANGFGQWTSSSSTTNATGYPACFLLANKLTTSTADDAQAGVLAAKGFTYGGIDAYPTVDVMKAVANLKGNVRYVWIDNDSVTGRNSFYVEGFDPGSSGIDISFSRLPGDDSIVQPTHAMGIPVPLAFGHHLVSTTNEANPLDRFDVAIDASYLYIVWEERISGVYSVWGAVVKLSDGSLALPATEITPFMGSGGRRPTVAVDIRNSDSIAHFDVSYLDTTIPSSTGNVWWTQYNGTGFTTATAISKIYSGLSAWDAPLHARILDASEYGVSPSTSNQRAVYVIAMTNCPSTSIPCFVHLFLDYIKNAIPFTPCEYCDGNLNDSRPSGCPVESGSPYYFQVEDNPIWAFANPYEGANSNSAFTDFTEFHCLYQLARNGYGILNPNNPLMIIPGSHVTSGYCVNGNGSSAFYDDPATSGLGIAKYCGAVNQMGVHVHWTGNTSGDHYYRRDKREFDQNIEENTLLTDTCVVGNTESGVGTASPILLSNLFLTLYSGPNVWLDFDNDATLNVGSDTNTGADFVNATAGFLGQVPGGDTACSANSWTITYAPGNSMDCYGGIIFYGNGQFTLTGSGDSMITTMFGNYVSSISDPVTWRIHNTSLDIVPCSGTTCIDITATDAIFDFQGNEDDFQGSILTRCNGSFTNCQFIPDVSSTYFGVSIGIYGNGTWDGSTGTGDGNFDASDYFSAENHTVTFTSCYSKVGIYIDGAWGYSGSSHQTLGVSPPSVVVNKGLYENYAIMFGEDFGSPWWPISITDATFDNMNGQGVIINEGIPLALPGATNKTYLIFIDHNDFKNFASTTGLYDFTPYSSGILVVNAPDTIAGGTLAPDPTSGEDALREAITVTNNVFDSAGSYGHSGAIDAAIHFMNATGDIGFNHITPGMAPTSSQGSKYLRGIWNESNNAAYPQLMTWSFICSNTVSGLTAWIYSAALQTDYFEGYVKLDTFTYSINDQISKVNDHGHVIFSTYSTNGYAAYTGFVNSRTDFSGVHGSDTASSGDDPGLNTLVTSGCCDEQIISLNDSATVYLGLEPYTPTWTVYGENTIIRSPSEFDIYGGAAVVGDISNNYWGGGSYVNVGATDWGGYLTSAPAPPGWFTCSSGLDITKRKGANALSFLKFNIPLHVDSAIDTCQKTAGDLRSDCACGKLGSEEYELSGPQGYDSAQAFLEDCPFYSEAWRAFSDILGDAPQAGGWPGFLAWLKSVLYLNPDTGGWYCSDVLDMLTAVQNAPDAQSICRYILASGKCPAFASAFAGTYSSAATARYQHWRDSIYRTLPFPGEPYFNDSLNADTLAHPFSDTAVPTLQEDSLEILLGPQYAGVQTGSPISSQALLSAQLLENPVSDGEIDVSFQMGRTALVTMELRDVLGRMVPLTYAKYQLEQPGQHNASIPAPTLPAGTYYLRITTDTGDAITLKLVKE